MNELAPADEDGLLDLLERWRGLQRQGKRVSAEELCPGRPDVAAELKQLAEFAGHVEGLAESAGQSTVGASPFTASPGPALEATAVLPGTSGRYQVEGTLGVGGMGAVYQAMDLQLGRRVALKLIRPERTSPELMARFEVEARSVAALDQPHIIKVFDVGTWSPPGEGAAVPFLSMELAEGGSLAGRLPQGRPQQPVESARLVALLARAMAHAHARGVVHRDLKPENILLAPATGLPALDTSWGCPKITDFGLAMWSGASGRVTRDREVLGTPAYMAPEQADGRADVGPPADVYALGVVLYRLLSGKLPFDCPSLAELLYKIAHVPAPPLKGVPAELARVVATCLDKSAARRPTMVGLAETLEAWLSKGSTEILPARPEWGGGLLRRGLLAGLAACLLVAGGVALWAAWGRGKKADPDPGPPGPAAVKHLRLEAFNTLERVERLGVVTGEGMANEVASLPFKAGVIIRAELSAPAYAILIAFNADGSEQQLWPPPGEAGGPVERIKFPDGVGPKGGPLVLYLNDEPRGGLQAFAVVASRKPLPPYEEWKKARGPVKWSRLTGHLIPYAADTDGVAPILEGRRVERSQVGELGQGPDLLPLCRALKSGGVEAVAVKAVPVEEQR